MAGRHAVLGGPGRAGHSEGETVLRRRFQLDGPAWGGRRPAGIRQRNSTAGASPASARRWAPPEAPTIWTTYLATSDADATAAKIKGAGSQLVMGPIDVTDVGRMAVAADPAGAGFGVWQARAFPGAQIVNEPGAMRWNEQMSYDFEASKAFYAAVFGYEYGDTSSDTVSYATFKVDGKDVGGIGGLHQGVPARTTDRLEGVLRRGGHRRHGRPGAGQRRLDHPPADRPSLRPDEHGRRRPGRSLHATRRHARAKPRGRFASRRLRGPTIPLDTNQPPVSGGATSRAPASGQLGQAIMAAWRGCSVAHCAPSRWDRRGDRSWRMRSCRSPALSAARLSEFGGAAGLPDESSGVSLASTSMLLARGAVWERWRTCLLREPRARCIQDRSRLCLWGDVLVYVEEVAGIVGPFDLDQPVVVLAVVVPNPAVVVVLHEVDVATRLRYGDNAS